MSKLINVLEKTLSFPYKEGMKVFFSLLKVILLCLMHLAEKLKGYCENGSWALLMVVVTIYVGNAFSAKMKLDARLHFAWLLHGEFNL